MRLMLPIFILIPCFIETELAFARDHHEFSGGPPPPRVHTTITRKPIKFEPSNRELKFIPEVLIKVKGNERIIKSNGIPNHFVGRFPNCGNPHKINKQSFFFSISIKPQINSSPYPLDSGWAFGVAINGVPFEPLAAEWYQGKRGSFWRYEALSGAISLGLDENHAHVQPGGKYHYHGLPTLLIKKLEISEKKHSPLIGWAADGFPIYNLYGYKNGKNSTEGIKEYRTSYKLKSGNRPGGNEPSGSHDGSFSADYQYVAGLGDLDQCNGIKIKTPEFPEGSYAYFLTRDWPIVPRCWMAEPDISFKQKRMAPPKRGLRPSDCPKREKDKFSRKK